VWRKLGFFAICQSTNFEISNVNTRKMESVLAPPENKLDKKNHDFLRFYSVLSGLEEKSSGFGAHAVNLRDALLPNGL
jgi:hypothetical protein